MWQLPPIYDNNVMDNNNLDGRLNLSPNHWKENFSLFYLTEKMRSMKDPAFSDLCDRVAVDNINENDEEFLQFGVKNTDSENFNESFKSGKLIYIVTTNKKRNFINNEKLDMLLPDEKEYVCNSIDNVKNLPSSRKLPKKVNDNPSKTGNLMKELKVKIGAPVVITTNHSKKNTEKTES